MIRLQIKLAEHLTTPMAEHGLSLCKGGRNARVCAKVVTKQGDTFSGRKAAQFNQPIPAASAAWPLEGIFS